MKSKIRILVLSNTPWSDDNSFGNSYSNIFGGMKDFEFANIYCRYGYPHNKVVKRHFQITEKSLLKNLIGRKCPSGKEVFGRDGVDVLRGREEKAFDRARIWRFQIFFWARDLIWKLGRWNSPELREFIEDFSPEILFQPVYYSNYLNNIALFLKSYTKVPMAGYFSDDVYTLRRFFLSPFFWINHFIIRSKIRKIVGKCEYLYVISEIQKQEYEPIFKKECRVLTKGADFSKHPPLKKHPGNPLVLTYTGGIGCGRWKMLAYICEALSRINSDKTRAEFRIYTNSPLTERIKNRLNVPGSSCLFGGIPFAEVVQVQAKADILVHVEYFGLKERLIVHQSFSTKIVDYLHSARCIFAVGTLDMASVKYLHDNDAALTACSIPEIYSVLKRLVDNPDLAGNYALKAWECGRKNHRIEKIQAALSRDLRGLLER